MKSKGIMIVLMVGLTIGLTLGGFIFVLAETQSEKIPATTPAPQEQTLQAQIQALQSQIAALQTKLKGLYALQDQSKMSEASKAVPKEVVKEAPKQTSASEPIKDVSPLLAESFTKSLVRGSTGDEVKRLQVILGQFSDVYPEGIVSGYFGSLTEKAVSRLQSKYGLPSVGKVGPKTQAVLNQLLPRLAKSEPKAAASSEVSATIPVNEPETVVKPEPTPTPVPVAQAAPYFTYSWQATSTSYLGEVYLPTPAPKPVVVIDGQPTIILNTDASVRLAQIYNVVLVDDEEPWDAFAAGMLFEMIRRVDEIWQRFPTGSLKWKVTLTSELISQDFESTPGQVRLSKAAFVFSNPTLQPGEAGFERVFYSNRLYRAVLGAFLNDKATLQSILQQRYGYQAGFGEPRERYQEFSAEELQFIITVLEDLPVGFHRISGLHKLIRLKGGLTNLCFPDAAAVAQDDYIEFSDKAFGQSDDTAIRLLIAHEFSHFLWDKILNQETRNEFMALSGWSLQYSNDLQPAPSGVSSDHPKVNYQGPSQLMWFRKTTTNFVSAYAAYRNPEEDFSETMAYYVYRPDWVRTVVPGKYNFLKRITKGYEYVILVEERFTFQVFDLEPDYTFPGKIIGVEINAYKESDGNNKIVATLELAQVGEGAAFARTTLLPPTSFQTANITFYPLENDPYKLRAEFSIGRFAAQGYWMPRQIQVHDRVDNRRYEMQNQFGWLLYIDNPDEDLEPPTTNIENIQSKISVQDGDYIVKVTLSVWDNKSGFQSGYAQLNQDEKRQYVSSYTDYNKDTGKVTFTFTIRKYHASGNWVLRAISLRDVANNRQTYDLTGPGLELVFPISTSNPDYTKPQLDINSIRIQAVPKRPEAPDGETDVTIWYNAWDNNAGLAHANQVLLKPTGGEISQGLWKEEFFKPYWPGSPSEPKTYEVKFILPVGSPPGTWVLRSITLQDKAGNTAFYNFTELGILRPFDVK